MARPPRDLRGPLVAASATVVALAAALWWALATRREGASTAELLADPEVRRRIVAELVAGTPDTYDSHPDPLVARTMQPELVGRALEGITLDTNAAGMRERAWASPKPEGLVRVVVVGDSFVFGFGVESEERLGTELERLLVERASFAPGEVECLHLGIPSWDAVAGATYVRRQLDALDPDLVVHLTVGNDLDDTAGVRGFGALAQFAPARREQVDVLLRSTTQRTVGAFAPNLLNAGLDHLSRRRFDEALGELLRLGDALRARGADLLVVAHWGGLGPVVARRWGALGEALVVLPSSFAEDASTWITPTDYHWNATGHARVAAALYAALAGRALGGRSVPEVADEPAAALLREGRRESSDAAALAALERVAERWPTELAFPVEGELAAKCVYGGVDREGAVGAYAALVLAPGATLRLSGAFLADRALSGARVRVLVDGRELGALVVRPGESFDERFDVGPRDGAAPLATVELRAEDFVYRGEDARRSAALRLTRAAFD